MSILNARTVERLLPALLLSGVFAFSGCDLLFPTPFPEVPRGGSGDDDDDAADDDDDDDDDDDGEERAPTIEITGVAPLTIPISGLVRIQYTVTDADSDGYTLTSTWIDSEGTERATTLIGGTGAELNQFVATGLTPPIDDSGELEWDSVGDVPTTAGNVVLQLCAIDSDGNDGGCDTFPDNGGISIQNTLESGLGDFCQPGDMELINWLGGRAVVPLAPGDGSCPNYQSTEPPLPDDFAAQFLIVMINPEGDDSGFTISATDQPTILGAPPPGRDAMREVPLEELSADQFEDGLSIAELTDEVRRMAIEDFASGGAGTGLMNGERNGCTEDLSDADVNSDARTFFFRDGIDDTAVRETRGANLRALGDHVAIYVDDETPIDIDNDCADPNNPIDPGDLPAFGFTNCDLENIVDVVEANVWPTLTDIFGEPSDVDENCRVTVFLSHRLNRLTQTDDDVTNDAFTVRSFAEPDIDLWQSNLTANPNSNEQEILFAYAPDPVGFWSDQIVSLEDYLSYELAGRIAIGLFDLISYTAHRGVGKTLLDKTNPTDLALPPAEEDWLNDGLGLLAADLTGFGSIAFQDAWIYMDRPHLLSLEEENGLADFQDRGGQYLFARYLADLYGDGAVGIDMFDLLMNSGCVGSDNVSNLIMAAEGSAGGDDDDSAGGDEEECQGDDEVFEEFVLDWATAMTVSGRTIADSSPPVPLVDDAVVTNYQTASTVSVPDPTTPVVGELYGANGFQQGFNVRDLNITYTGGTDAAGATALTSLDVRTENLDVLMFHPQADFFGVVAGQYGVVSILVSGLEQEENYLLIETASGSPLVGRVIRINDASPHEPRLTLEDVDGAKITTVRELGMLDDFGERNVIGRIDATESVTASPTIEPPEGDDDDSAGGDDDDDDASGDDDDSAEEPSEVEVSDTDRYRFSLNAQQLVGVWVDRRHSNIDAGADLGDPFLAVMPVDDVPDAFDYNLWGFGPATGPCFDALLYQYPVVMPAWIGAQANISSDPVTSSFAQVVALASAPGSDTVSYACEFDHDQDGIPDVEEPQPENLVQQIALRQAENLAIDADFYVGTFDTLVPPATALDVTAPFFGATFIDLDSNESPDDDFATSVRDLNIGGRQVEEGEEAVWYGYLPAGEYVIIVGDGSGTEGPYDLSVKVITGN